MKLQLYEPDDIHQFLPVNLFLHFMLSIHLQMRRNYFLFRCFLLDKLVELNSLLIPKSCMRPGRLSINSM